MLDVKRLTLMGTLTTRSVTAKPGSIATIRSDGVETEVRKKLEDGVNGVSQVKLYVADYLWFSIAIDCDL